MGEITKIQWTDHTFNAWIGCEKLSPACKNCYAEESTPARVSKARGLPLWGPDSARHVTSKTNWREPLKWNRAAERDGVIRRVFTNSLGDVFEDRRDLDPVRARLWELIGETPYLEWLLLTKRIDRVLDLVPWRWRESRFPWNVRIGTTVENQEYADERLPHLFRIPADNFISMEPLLGPVDLGHELLAAELGRYPFPTLEREHRTKFVDLLDWVIVGGESGSEARPFCVNWAASIIYQCRAAGVPVFMKQLGSRPMIEGVGLLDDDDPDAIDVCRVGGITHPKGGEPSEWHEQLRVREFPKRGRDLPEVRP